MACLTVAQFVSLPDDLVRSDFQLRYRNTYHQLMEGGNKKLKRWANRHTLNHRIRCCILRPLWVLMVYVRLTFQNRPTFVMRSEFQRGFAASQLEMERVRSNRRRLV